MTISSLQSTLKKSNSDHTHSDSLNSSSPSQHLSKVESASAQLPLHSGQSASLYASLRTVSINQVNACLEMVDQLQTGKHIDLCLTDDADLQNTRLLIQHHLQQPSVYIHHPDDISTLLHEVTLSASGAPTTIPGPLTKVLEEGGIIIINEANFSADELETLNELKEGGRFQGKDIHSNVAVLSLFNKSSLSQRSSALFSRARFVETDSSFQPEKQLCENWQIPVQKEHSTGEAVIELHDSYEWKNILLPHIGLGLQGEWQALPGLFALNKSNPIIIRNAPVNDPHFADWYRQKNAQLKSEKKSIILEQGYSEDYIQENLKNKSTFKVNETADWNINTYNFNAHVKHNYCLKQKHIATKLPLVDFNTSPKILITSGLDASQWHELFSVPHAFSIRISTSASKSLPPELKKVLLEKGMKFHPLHEIPLTSVPEIIASSKKSIAVKTIDEGLFSQQLHHSLFKESLVFIDITPDSGMHELIEEWKPTSQRFEFETQRNALYNALVEGRNVIVRGLNCNPSLRCELESLLHPPYYCIVNGERINLEDLPGKMIVLNSSQENVHGNEIYKEFYQTLQIEYPSLSQKQFDHIITFGQILQKSGAIDSNKIPAFSYSYCKKLISLLTKNAHQSMNNNEISTWIPHIHPLLKDTFLADFRQQKGQYSYFKVAFKMLFDEQVQLSCDFDRLKSYLNHCLRKEDLETQVWQIANTFSPELLRMQIPQPALGSDHKENINHILNTLVQLINHHPALMNDSDLKNIKALIHNSSIPQFSNLIIDWTNIANLKKPKSLDRTAKLLEKSYDVLTKHQGLSLQGPPGAGKSYLVDQMIQAVNGRRYSCDISQESSTDFYTAISQWAHDTQDGTKCLVIDEANLAKPNYFNFLCKAFESHPRYCFINGKIISLSQQHKIIITGNAESLAGRNVHRIFKEHFIPVTFKPLKDDFLKEKIILPMMSFPLMSSMHQEKMTNKLVKIHQILQQRFPELGFSPRNLEQTLLYFKMFLSQDFNVHYKSFAPLLARSIYENYSGLLANEDQDILKLLLKTEFELEDLPTITISDQYPSKKIISTPSTEALRNQIVDFLKVRELRCNGSLPNNKGQKGLLIEGPAGRGKDTLAAEILESKKIPYVHLNANFDLNALKEVLDKATQEGKVVILSEANLLSSNILEGLLNDILASSGQAQPHAGFALIVTMNPSSYQGRSALSAAFKNRFTYHRISDYSSQEIRDIAQHFIGNAHYSILLANLHNQLIEVLKQKGSNVFPTLRQLKKCAEEFNINVSENASDHLHTVFQKEYRYYLILSKSIESSAKQNNLSIQKITDNLSNYLSWIWNKTPTCPIVQRSAFIKMPATYALALNTILISDSLTEIQDVQILSKFANTPKDFLGNQVASLAVRKSEETQLTTASTQTRKSFSKSLIGYVADKKPGFVSKKLGRFIGFSMTPPEVSGVTSQLSENSVIGKIEFLVPRSDVSLTSLVKANFLPQHRYDLLGNPIASIRSHSSALNNLQQPVAKISINIANHVGNIYFLPTLSNAFPSAVHIHHQYIQPEQNPEGNWYIKLPIIRSSSSLNYSLHSEPNLLLPPQQEEIETYVERLNLESDSELNSLITALKDNHTEVEEIIQNLLQHFQVHYNYAKQAITTYKQSMSNIKRALHFLKIKQGKCVEFSTTFGLILKTHFGIEVRKVNGYTFQNNNIDSDGHAWIEYFDIVKEEWIAIETTNALPNSNVESSQVNILSDQYPDIHFLKEMDKFKNILRLNNYFYNNYDLKKIVQTASIILKFPEQFSDLFYSNQVRNIEYTNKATNRLDVIRLIHNQEPFIKTKSTKDFLQKKIFLDQKLFLKSFTLSDFLYALYFSGFEIFISQKTGWQAVRTPELLYRFLINFNSREKLGASDSLPNQPENLLISDHNIKDFVDNFEALNAKSESNDDVPLQEKSEQMIAREKQFALIVRMKSTMDRANLNENYFISEYSTVEILQQLTDESRMELLYYLLSTFKNPIENSRIIFEYFIKDPKTHELLDQDPKLLKLTNNFMNNFNFTLSSDLTLVEVID